VIINKDGEVSINNSLYKVEKNADNTLRVVKNIVKTDTSGT
jgi:hypothetical protein